MVLSVVVEDGCQPVVVSHEEGIASHVTAHGAVDVTSGTDGGGTGRNGIVVTSVVIEWSSNNIITGRELNKWITAVVADTFSGLSKMIVVLWGTISSVRVERLPVVTSVVVTGMGSTGIFQPFVTQSA